MARYALTVKNLLNFQFQGLLALVIATPFLFIATLSQVTAVTLIALGLVMIGISGESLADHQLQKFKNAHLGKVCDVGLWRYSRHPNYFFEWLIWVGFAIAGVASPLGWLGFISPALLFFLMLKITGPITERGSIEARGEQYLQYQKKTSMFFPWLGRHKK